MKYLNYCVIIHIVCLRLFFTMRTQNIGMGDDLIDYRSGKIRM